MAYPFRLIRVKCPRCSSEVLVSIGQEVIEEARSSPTGLTTVAVPHSGHVLLIHVDANGHERGAKTVSIVHAEVLQVAPGGRE
ncbi:hypothetical protein IG193_07295 [Infirmifilum lucidum]|uniref:Uncharacterized protein n=1 Tax=Infirmifilum lucidum TaxID=2776706 RepID=A0A7L9FHS4_9CREN|nr:hypothetical protein [Infirmifilum lucidum]QOJ78553.1 hypothetical protein IG193_07295 [Infirmifilum lucidum]